MKGLRTFLPNRLKPGLMAMVTLRNGMPDPCSWQPFSALQIIGGRRWSLSVIRTESPRTQNQE